MTTTFVPNTWQLGSIDLSTVVTAGTLGAPFTSSTVNPLPSVPIEQMLGQIVGAYNPSATTSTENGWAEFIFLAVPTSTTVTPNLVYRWNPATFQIVVVPTAVTSSALSGSPIAVAINTVASNTTSIQYTWFQVTGRCQVLRSISGTQNVQPDKALYVSNVTAGRVRGTASIFRTIIGMRSANLATVATATSTLAAYLYRPSVGPGV